MSWQLLARRPLSREAERRCQFGVQFGYITVHAGYLQRHTAIPGCFIFSDAVVVVVVVV